MAHKDNQQTDRFAQARIIATCRAAGLVDAKHAKTLLVLTRSSLTNTVLHRRNNVFYWTQ
eukprot:306381-Chlamydomonas_euryale.AAC.6